MTAVPSVKEDASAEPLFKLRRIPWPEGTAWFAFRTWVALAISYYAAFFLELEGASSVGVCVLILAQPQQGMVLSKSIYRFAATIVGVVVGTTLSAVFPQDRTMLLASFAVVMAIQTALGSVATRSRSSPSRTSMRRIRCSRPRSTAPRRFSSASPRSRSPIP